MAASKNHKYTFLSFCGRVFSCLDLFLGLTLTRRRMKCLIATQSLEETAHDHSPLQTVLPPCPFRKNSLNENAFLYKMYKYAQQKKKTENKNKKKT